MKIAKINKSFIVANDMHLKNIFVSDTYLELGIIDIDIISRLLNNEIINLNDIVYFLNQNKGLGGFNIENEMLRDFVPHFFFLNLCKNTLNYELCITYGLLRYNSVDSKETFMPIFLMPIKIYYEDQLVNDDTTYGGFDSLNSLKVQLSRRPVLNPMIYTVFQSTSKLQFLQSIDVSNVQGLDYALEAISKINEKNISVSLDNYLTYYSKKQNDIILTSKKNIAPRYPATLSIDKLYRINSPVYLSRVFNRDQRVFIERAVNGESMVLTGVNGTGKTSVLKDILVNNIGNNKKTLFISSSYETLEDVNKFLEEKHLNRFSANLTDSFDKLTNTRFDDLFLEDSLETNEYIKLLNEYYDKLEDYENDLGSSISDFKVTEIIENYYNSSKELLNKETRKFIDNIDNIYKHEYEIIFHSLKSLENNFAKIKSFRNSIWNAIPIVNNIKHIGEVLNIVVSLNDSFKKMRELEIKLCNFGVRSVTSFSEMKKCIEPLEVITDDLIPEIWKKSVKKYKEAIRKTKNITIDIEDFTKIKEKMDSKYNDILSLDIEKEISYLYGDFYKESDDIIINRLLENEKELSRVISEANICIEDFRSSATELKDIIGWDFLSKDDCVDVIKEMNELFNNYQINGKMLVLVLSKKTQEELAELNQISNNISEVTKEMEAMVKDSPSLASIDFNKKDIKYDSEIVRTYDAKFKKQKRLSRDYMDSCGVSYVHHEDNLKAIEAIKNLYEKIKAHRYRKIVCDYLQSIDDNKYIEFLVISNKFMNAYKNVYQIMDKFSKYKFKYDKNNYQANVERFSDYIKYLNELFDSNRRVYKLIIEPKNKFATTDDYYDIKKNIDTYNDKVAYFDNNKEYKELFGYLYQNEKTNADRVVEISIQYNDYMSNFVSEAKIYESFEKYNDFRAIVDSIHNLILEIVEYLRLYSLTFKDSVSRYYYSNIETNMEYLNKLINSEDELILYLNITGEIGVLNDYGLSKIIEFIEANDNISNIADIFDAVYFERLVDRYLSDKKYLLDTNGYLELLEKTRNLEDLVCKYRGTKYINNLIKKIPVEYKNKKYKTTNYDAYFKNNQDRLYVYLCDLDFALYHYRLLNYDTIIIDDAHTISSGDCNLLFKDKQVIIVGDYQSNKIVNQNLVSLATSISSVFFRSRYETGPRLLTNDSNSRSPYLANYSDNLGIDIVNGKLDSIIDYIYSKYIEDINVRFNFYIKSVDDQKIVFEQIAKKFYNYNISENQIIYFLNNNIFISDLTYKHYNKGDYNIIKFNDYYNEDSQVNANNYMEILSQAHKRIVIYDENNLLSKTRNTEFFNLVNSYVQETNAFKGYIIDDVTNKISSKFIDKGYEVLYPGNGINFAIKANDSNKIVAVAILFSNGKIYNLLSEYRLLYEQYINNNQLLIFTVLPDLVERLNEKDILAYEDRIIKKLKEL